MRFNFEDWNGHPIEQHVIKDMIRDLVRRSDEEGEPISYSWCGDTLVMYINHNNGEHREIVITKVLRHGTRLVELHNPESEWFDRLDV